MNIKPGENVTPSSATKPSETLEQGQPSSPKRNEILVQIANSLITGFGVIVGQRIIEVIFNKSAATTATSQILVFKDLLISVPVTLGLTLGTYIFYKRLSRKKNNKKAEIKAEKESRKEISDVKSEVVSDTVRADNAKTEVIFFPDKHGVLNTEAVSETKGVLYRDLLSSSDSLRKLLAHLSSARRSVDLCLYLFTSQDLADAILGVLKSKRIRIRMIVDDGNFSIAGSQVKRFLKAGALVRSKPGSYLMHHKFAIVDDSKLISGSFNWTMQAIMGNKENVIVSQEPGLVDNFRGEFERLWKEMEFEKQ